MHFEPDVHVECGDVGVEDMVRLIDLEGLIQNKAVCRINEHEVSIIVELHTLNRRLQVVHKYVYRRHAQEQVVLVNNCL